MNDDAAIVVDGTSVRFVSSAGGALRVLADERDVGSLDPVADGDGYTAQGADGEPLTRPSQWGGRVTARFGSKELAVRALLSIRRA